MSELWATELTAEETEALIQKAVEQIRKRKLELPATLLLEMHKPVLGIGSQAAVVFSPFLVPFLGFDGVNDYTRLFSKRENVERLLELLESESRSEGAA